MRKAALVLVSVAALALTLSGCGTKVAGVPGTVASVNGTPISASSYLDQVSRRSGQDVLRNMIEQQIVLQWAKDEGVSPKPADVQKHIDELKNEGQYEDQVMLVGEDGLKAEFAGMQARANLGKKLSKITDKDLEQAYGMMMARYIHGPRSVLAFMISSKRESMENAVKALKNGKDFDEVAAEFSEAGVARHAALDPSQPNLSPTLAKAVKETGVGKFSEVVPIGIAGRPTQFIVFKVIRTSPAENKQLKDVKEEVAEQVALQKTQMDPTFQKKLNEKMKAASVQVNIKQYQGLVQSFKNPPEPSPMMSAPQRVPQPAPKPGKK